MGHVSDPNSSRFINYVICLQSDISLEPGLSMDEIRELATGDSSDLMEFFRNYTRFFREMTYDVVSYEVCINEILPDGGAILGGRPGPIQNRRDFDSYLFRHTSSLRGSLFRSRYHAPYRRRIL